MRKSNAIGWWCWLLLLLAVTVDRTELIIIVGRQQFTVCGGFGGWWWLAGYLINCIEGPPPPPRFSLLRVIIGTRTLRAERINICACMRFVAQIETVRHGGHNAMQCNDRG